MSSSLPASSPEPTIGELVAGMTADVGTLVRKEMELAKAELREEARTTGKAAGMLGAAGVAGHMTLLFLSFALAWGLSEIVPEGVAFLIVGVLYAIATFVLATKGRERMQAVRPPEQTIETVKEDVAWAKARMS
jgi:hypothetical protein